MASDRTRELAKELAALLPDLKTFDGKPIVFDWHDDFRHRTLGLLDAFERETLERAANAITKTDASWNIKTAADTIRALAAKPTPEVKK